LGTFGAIFILVGGVKNGGSCGGVYDDANVNYKHELASQQFIMLIHLHSSSFLVKLLIKPLFLQFFYLVPTCCSKSLILSLHFTFQLSYSVLTQILVRFFCVLP